MFAGNCPPTTSASDMSRTESYPSQQIRSPRSPSTWSECRSRCRPEPLETGLAPSPPSQQNPHKRKGARKRAQVSGGTKTKLISSNVQQDKLSPPPNLSVQSPPTASTALRCPPSTQSPASAA